MVVVREELVGQPAVPANIISLREVSKVYPVKGGAGVAAVRAVNLEVAAGEFIVLTGRSGCGKTTLLNLMAGLAWPTSGEVRLGGAKLSALSEGEQARLRNQKTGYIFQFPSLLPTLTALQNATLPVLFATPCDRELLRARGAELLQKLGLEKKLHSLPRQLSAGEQTRVVIARALVNQPAVLLADEPTAALDEQTEVEIMNLLQEFHRSTGVTVVMVTHNRDLIRYATRALEMADGRLL